MRNLFLILLSLYGYFSLVPFNILRKSGWFISFVSLINEWKWLTYELRFIKWHYILPLDYVFHKIKRPQLLSNRILISLRKTFYIQPNIVELITERNCL